MNIIIGFLAMLFACPFWCGFTALGIYCRIPTTGIIFEGIAISISLAVGGCIAACVAKIWQMENERISVPTKVEGGVR